MGTLLNLELTSTDDSSDFLCPHCAAGGFEVVGVERHIGAHDQAPCTLVMRCLTCHGQFRHRAEIEDAFPRDLRPAPTLAATHI